MEQSVESGASRRRGRPKTTGSGRLIGLRWHPAQLDRIDRWARLHEADSRAEAIRRMVDEKLAEMDPAAAISDCADTEERSVSRMDSPAKSTLQREERSLGLIVQESEFAAQKGSDQSTETGRMMAHFHAGLEQIGRTTREILQPSASPIRPVR
jgi:hypothetical protein